MHNVPGYREMVVWQSLSRTDSVWRESLSTGRLCAAGVTLADRLCAAGVTLTDRLCAAGVTLNGPTLCGSLACWPSVSRFRLIEHNYDTFSPHE